jgi:undecaprenyl phosphate N,N'-diacetylbacillosamine 1-phosphate transferase
MTPYLGKRVFDVLAAGTACAVFAPVVVGVTLAAWLEDGGPPLFSQSRVGRGRSPFTLLKFRSMRDGQVTRVGRWLRDTGIDELPQFVNVVRGEMSVVGPRPLTGKDVERLGWDGADHDWRFAAKPGITGLSQLLAGRGARSSERLDRLYLRRQSLLLDLQLVALSLAVNIAGKRKVRRFLRRPSTEPGRAF